MSNASTFAPSLLAVAIACSPATPAPSTSTFAGGIVPAAVIIKGKNLPMEFAAIKTALYPASELCEERTSILWARAMRGMSSIAKAVAPAPASLLSVSGLVRARSRPITTAPGFRWSISWWVG